MPVVISVLIFVVYYIIDSGATRVGKSGEMNVALGTWMSTIILAPLGGFLTYKSNKDSVVFNIDVYLAFFRKSSASVPNVTCSARKLSSRRPIIRKPSPRWTKSVLPVRDIHVPTGYWVHLTISKSSPTTSTMTRFNKSVNRWKMRLKIYPTPKTAY